MAAGGFCPVAVEDISSHKILLLQKFENNGIII
jgi:hypothetical protein